MADVADVALAATLDSGLFSFQHMLSTQFADRPFVLFISYRVIYD